jgi:hypothetical protein
MGMGGGLSPGIKRPGREVHHSTPSSAEVKNEWSYTYPPLICLHSLYREHFTFTLPMYYLWKIAVNNNKHGNCVKLPTDLT